jgi:2,3-bisphosphoglycerate-independent phosphoglycerate mutase
MTKVLLAIMDGVGISENQNGNAFTNANTPNLDYLMKNSLYTTIYAHGTHVGLPSDEDQGNSEVGHNAMGCGQIYSQGAKLVNDDIESKRIYESDTWKKIVEYSKDNTLHFIGLLSDGGVHSHINHLISMIEQSKLEGNKKVRIHILLDGRDVPKQSALEYVDMLENKLKELNDDNFDCRIASGGGRMVITMDRYEANWNMVEKGWHTHVLGDARKFNTAKEAIETYRSENPDVIDQDLDSFVIVDNEKAIGTINDGDGVIFFNFRGDRAIEISKAFDEENFDKFDRVRYPKVMYAGMLQYDSELKIPKNYLVMPPNITNTLTEELCKHNIREYAISETQKFGHVTYFWNGNKIDKINPDLETYEEVPSDVISFDKAPKMKATEITDKFIDALKSNKYDFLRLNYPNGDMVGHTGNYDATIEGMESVDYNIGRIINEVNNMDDCILIVTADHGNAEEMIDSKGEAKTSHTINKVPFIIYGKNMNKYKIKDGEFGLANLASTITTLFDIEKNDVWKESIIEKVGE